MEFRDKLGSLKRIKHILFLGSSAIFITYHIHETCRSVEKVVNTRVLESEKRFKPQYIYIEDPSYAITLKLEQDKESRKSLGIHRIMHNLQQSLAWKLLWLCRHGTRDQRNIALEQLAMFKNDKQWEWLKLAQGMDAQTAVLLARTRGTDSRYFLPPPIHVRRAALSPRLLSYKLRDMIVAVQNIHPHSCIDYFLKKYFTNVQEQAVEAESIPSKPHSISERDLCLQCLDALHHHISLFYDKHYEEDKSARALIEFGLLPKLAELLLRFKEDDEIDYNVLRVLTVLSVHSCLLKDFFENGLIGELCRLLQSKQIKLASSAAVCLANLSGEYCYRPGLFILHPLYRSTKSHICDILLVHGLKGGVFVTWRQRDRKKLEPPLGAKQVKISFSKGQQFEDTNVGRQAFLDPEVMRFMKELRELDELAVISDFEVVLHDIPIKVLRENIKIPYTATNRYTALLRESQDRSNYTYCWPKDWLPKDCDGLRVLGVNYWSSLSEWLERCPLHTAEISVRAADLAPALLDADVAKSGVPVIWLAHSMGGLIVKQTLIDAANSGQSTMHRLCDNTKAVLFYSTPHKGSAVATLAKPAAAILWPTNDVRQLKENSPFLLKQNEDFVKLTDLYKWETISFVESLPTLVTTFKVPFKLVETSSGDIGRGVLYQLPLDHLSICKPATRQSVLYLSVLDVLMRVTSKVDEKYSR